MAKVTKKRTVRVGKIKKTKLKMSMNQKNLITLFTIVLVISAIVIFYITQRIVNNKTKQEAAQIKKEQQVIAKQALISRLGLGKAWSITEENLGKTIVKFEKNVKNSTIKPTILLIKSGYSDTSPADYSYKIVQGAYSTLPSLSYYKDNIVEKAELYTRELTGSYYINKDTKVSLMQNLYLKENTIWVLTASYEGNEIEAELNEAFQLIQKRYIK